MNVLVTLILNVFFDGWKNFRYIQIYNHDLVGNRYIKYRIVYGNGKETDFRKIIKFINK